MGVLDTITDGLGLTNNAGTDAAVKRANAALEAAKSSAAGVNADAAALVNPALQAQIDAATNAVMGKFGGSGNLYSGGTQRGIATAVAPLAANSWENAAQRALAMQQGNAGITSGIGANNVANAQGKGLINQVGPLLAGIFG